MLKTKVRVGITMGDPSGIGPYIASVAVEKLTDKADLTVIGERFVFDKAKRSSSNGKYRFVDLKNVSAEGFRFGEVKAEYGKASIEYLDKALELIAAGELDCIVTCPISKESINLAGFSYQGHTEYFAKKTGVSDFVMLLLNRFLKISLVTRHIPLKDVPRKIDAGVFSKTVLITHRALQQQFSLARPRIAVCGLNPHASDNGVIGKEENLVIKPEIGRLKRKGICIDGPISADVAIAKAYRGHYDCLIAMYHDQALIPLKLLDAKSGVNITLGLPFIRTSPLHGTAFDLAKKSLCRADPSSLIEAIQVAIQCYLKGSHLFIDRYSPKSIL